MRTFLLTALAFAAAATTAVCAQAPTVELQLATQTLELGEQVSAQLVCTNTARPDTPRWNVPDGLELKLLISTPSSSSVTQIINGQMTQRVTFTFPMQLTAMKEGTYTLAPITVPTESGTFQTQPVQVVVRKSDPGGKAQGDRYIFAELEVEPKTLYVTQTFVATLTFGIRKVELGGRVFDLDMLRDVLDVNGSQLSVFANGRAQRSERWLADSNGVRRSYEVFRVTKEVRAEQVGEMQVGPVFLKAEYPTALRRAFFGGYEVTSRRRETARTEAIAVIVQAPPAEGRPSDFIGAIGQYTMKIGAKPVQVEQDQPITLTITISGAPLEGVAGPHLSRQVEMATRFDYTKDELVGDVTGDAKVFRRAIFPKQSGEQTIPPISWSFFDPAAERYETLTSDPIPLTVTPAAGRTRQTGIAMSEAEPGEHMTRLTVVAGGISPNYVDADAVLADQSFTLTGKWLVALAGSPIAWATITLIAGHRRRLAVDPAFAKRRRASRRAFARIRRAMRDGQPVEQLDALAEALTAYVADRFGLPEGVLTSEDVRQALERNGYNGPLALDICGFLELCDAVRYAPTGARPLSAQQAAAKVRAWIRNLERRP